MNPDSPSPVIHYHPTLLFRGATVFLALSTVYLGSEVWRTGDFFVILFFITVLIATAGMALGSLASATWDGQTFSYRVPLRPLRTLTSAQIIDIEIVGRRTRALLIHYHPCDEQGHIDRTQELFLNLTPLQDQIELLLCLQGEEETPPADA